jgi:hypothetical protein
LLFEDAPRIFGFSVISSMFDPLMNHANKTDENQNGSRCELSRYLELLPTKNPAQQGGGGNG